ncbi:acetate--CoA ligase [Phosphitispora fastidiosa]|uniref:acetate--CoA ligase n=1 Tax=Phosphitispora fastidiosa TaxID=2837202 RepID=UPI001E34CD1A|nr:acetate--CoA ligase [Phosphitispora fastidiosa]MBU7007688.1 acetyl-CoA synthetase [Phosphitispora fastidiosa]
MVDYQVLLPSQGKHNMENYDKFAESFTWESVEKEFSWYTTGKLNIAYEAIDRQVEERGRGKETAILYCDRDKEIKVTFAQLQEQSNKFANLLLKLGISKGDRVFIFMPRTPELLITFAGIVKIGAIAGPLFEAFMEDAVRDRLADSEAVAIVTTPALKNRIPRSGLTNLRHVIVIGSDEKDLMSGEICYEKEMAEASDKLTPVWVDRDDPMFLLYTSGSTGKPKGVLHTHNIMLGQLFTLKYVHDLREDDVFWCTADPGWITGVSYSVWGPWLLGKATIIRGGRFSADEWYGTIEKYGVTVWYSAPTAFRMLMAADEELVKKHNLSSLRHITSVGEPLNPEVIMWAMKVFGVRIHETWFMTETGVNMICCYPCMDIRVGSMCKPIPGVEAAIIDDDGNILPPMRMGNLALKKGWPGMMKEIWRNPEKYNEYFKYDPWYVSGDSAYMDEDGYFWFQGRVDDVIKTSGERVGPFEVESKLVEHPAVAEAGVIGKPDQVRGNIIKAFISLREGFAWSPELAEEIRNFVKTELAAHAAPREIEVRDKLPKTRSGKIMRRVLKAEEMGLPTGDLSTLED